VSVIIFGHISPVLREDLEMSGFSEKQSGGVGFLRKFLPSRFINSEEETAESSRVELTEIYFEIQEVRVFRTLLDLEQQTSIVQLSCQEVTPAETEYQSLGKVFREVTLQLRVEQKELLWITGLAKRTLKLLDYQKTDILETRALEDLCQSQSEEIVELRKEIEHLGEALNQLVARPAQHLHSTITFETREIAP
jgi:DNA-binding Xre family transcriptional regulator